MKNLFKKPRILVVANQKGGVGKTTTAINLGTSLAAIKERVLIIDMDPQGNASTGLGIDRNDRTYSIFDVLMGSVDLSTAIMPTKIPNFSIIASTLDLLGFEMEVSDNTDRTFKLKSSLSPLLTPNEKGEYLYSYILIDCPPSLNLLTINAMAASHAVLVPLQCEFFALEGLSQLMTTIEQVRGAINPSLDIQGVVLTMFDQRNNLANQVRDDVRQHFGEKVYNTVIPRNVRVSEAPSYGKPVLLYDHKCAGSQAYIELATEIVKRERKLAAA